MKRLLGIYRERDYSPGRHQSNDALILQKVAEKLRGRNFAVDLKEIEEIKGPPAEYDAVISMCQGRTALEKLGNWEDRGIVVINRASAARNAHRDRLAGLMKGAGIPFPETKLISTIVRADEVPTLGNNGLWLKRGDIHASVARDVQHFDSTLALASALVDFASRGIAIAVIQAHQTGTEIKFYAIGDHNFFFWLPANGDLRRTKVKFDELELRSLARRAAAATGLEIFGGDAIVSESGALTLIDLNDWPSFAPCRDEASNAIADFIASRVSESQQFVSSANQDAF